MGANTQGRIIAAQTALGRAFSAKDKTREELGDAKREARLKREEYERNHTGFQRESERMVRAEARLRKQFATVENIGAAKNVVFDSTSALSRFFGYFKNPVVSFAASGIGAVSESLRGPTSSGLLGIIPGSTNSLPGGGVIDSAQTAAGLVDDLASIQGLASPALESLGNFNALSSAYQHGYDAGQLLQGNNIFAATPLPRVGNVFNLSSAQLDEVANQLRNGFEPGLLEQWNGLDPERIAGDIEEYSDARDKAAAYGRKLRGSELSAEEAERKQKLAQEKDDEAFKEAKAAIAALAAALPEKGVSVEQK